VAPTKPKTNSTFGMQIPKRKIIGIKGNNRKHLEKITDN
jgi:hypothetical protein